MVEDNGFWSIFFSERHAVLTYLFYKKIERSYILNLDIFFFENTVLRKFFNIFMKCKNNFTIPWTSSYVKVFGLFRN